MPEIKLVSSTGKEFLVEMDIARKSITIKTMLEDLGFDDGYNGEPVPLPNVESHILEKIIQWCTKHKDDDKDAFTNLSMDQLPVWDEKDFFDEGKDQKILFDLILAANYLDIKGLLDLGCKVVAKMIKNCGSAEAIREKFNISADLPQEEVAVNA